MAGCSGKPPNDLGVAAGSLADCPSTPNCVSSMAGDPSRFVEPLNYEGDRRTAMEKLVAVVTVMSKATIVQRQPEYLRAEFRSKFFGFVDDVEFYLPDDENIIHIRSASRIGYYDFGVNERRVERIRQLWHRHMTGIDQEP